MEVQSIQPGGQAVAAMIGMKEGSKHLPSSTIKEMGRWSRATAEVVWG